MVQAGLAASTYINHGGVTGRERLRILARVMASATLALLDRLRIVAGMTCIDVACGGGDVATELARRVGPTGGVLGFDNDPVAIDLARSEAAVLSLPQIEYRVLDLLTGDLPQERFDIVYVRFLLTHLAEPAAALARIASLARPGGLVVAEDIDLDGHFCHPPSADLDTFVVWHREAVRRRGGDSDIGRSLPAMFEAGGLAPAELNIVQPAGLRGEVKLIAPITMEAIAESVIASGLATFDQIAAVSRNLYRLAKDRTALVSTVRVMQVWARAPVPAD